jgi:hypothetical protein
MSRTQSQTRPDFYIKEGSRRPVFRDQLRHAHPNGGIVDLEDANHVRFYLQHIETGELIINSEAEIRDREEGIVEYAWTEDDAIVSGPHDAEWRVEFEDGSTHWLPENRNLRVFVTGGISGRELEPGDIDEVDLEVRSISTDILRANNQSAVDVQSDLDLNNRILDNVGAVNAQAGTFDTISAESGSIDDFQASSGWIDDFQAGAGQISNLDVDNIDLDEWTVREDDDAVVFERNGTHFEVSNTGAKVFEEPTEPYHVVRKQELDNLDPGDGNGGEGGSFSSLNVVDVSEYGFTGDRSGGDLFSFINDNGPAKYVLPEGDFEVGERIDFRPSGDASDWEYLEIEAQGSGARIHPTNQDVKTLFHSNGDSSPLDYFRIRGLHVVQDPAGDPEESIDCGLIRLAVNEWAKIEDCSIEGKREYHSLRAWYEEDRDNRDDPSGELYSVRLNMLEKDAIGWMKNVRIPDGGEGNDRPRTIPFSVEAENEGTQIYEGCHAGGFQGNGYYWKDGHGHVIAIGCTASNIGGQAFRLGHHDMSIGGRTINDDRLDDMDHNAGAQIDLQEPRGSTVLGHHAIAHQANQPVVRVRAANEQASVKDVYIENYTTEYGVRTGVVPGHDEGPETAGDAKIVLENLWIRQIGEPSSTRTAQVRLNRENTIMRDSTIETERNWHIPLEVGGGEAHLENCRFVTHGSNSFDVHLIDDTDFVSFEKCQFDEPIHLDEVDSCAYLEVVGCDFGDLSSPWNNDAPDDVSGIDSYTFIRNPPFTDSTEYGELSQYRFHADRFQTTGTGTTSGFQAAGGDVVMTALNSSATFYSRDTNQWNFRSNNSGSWRNEFQVDASDPDDVYARLGGEYGVMTDETETGRRLYVSSSEPSDWEDGDLWAEPED